MSNNSIHLNVHSYVYFSTHQNISCSLLHLMGFKGFCRRMYCKSQRRSSQDKDYLQTITMYIHRIVWDLSLDVVIVCILWMAFFSGRLHWVDHYRSSGMTGWAHLPLLCKLFVL